MNVVKSVRNISTSSGEFDSVSARPGETVEFIIYINTSVANATIDNIRVSDSLPSGLRYLGGTTTIDGFATGDGVTSGGLNIGSVATSRTIIVRFRAQVESETFFSAGITTLTNRATVDSSNAGNVTDTALVSVSRVQTVIDNFALSIRKLGKNIARGENAESGSIVAGPNDTLEFVLRIRSLSSTRVNNVIVQDVLPGGLNYIGRTTSIDGIITADGITGSGINIGPLEPNQEKVVRLNVQVAAANNFSIGSVSLINTINVRADNVPTLAAQLPITVTKGEILGISAVTKVSTGGETALVAAAFSALMAGGLTMFGRSYFGRRRGVLAAARRHARDKNRFNFAG